MQLNEQTIHELIQRQRQFFYSGQTRDVQYRTEMLQRLYTTIKEHEQLIIRALEIDLGKSPFESYTTEIGFVLSSIRHMLANIDEWSKAKKVKTPIHLQPAKSFIVHEPYGSVLIIGPFNYPFQLVMEPLIGAIAAGNCVVVKPSEFAEATGNVIAQLITAIFPTEFVQVVHGEEKETSALLHASFDYIFFTGSTTVGKIVMKAAAEHLTPLTLELGGKSPVIVDQTANIQYAAERIVWGKFMNVGQTCVAPDYVVVHEQVKAPLLNCIKKTIQHFYGKNPFTNKEYGKIINTKHVDRLVTLLKQQQAQIIYGGDYRREERYIAPTIFDHCTWDDPIMEDEIFGPLLPILTYNDLGELLHIIRQRPKSLAAYFFSENERASQYFIEMLPFGGGCINDTVSHVANTHLPFGGVGSSGMNAYHGEYSFKLFTREKSMMKRSSNMSVNIASPPYGRKLSLVKRVLK